MTTAKDPDNDPSDAAATERKRREAFTEAWFDLEISVSDLKTMFDMGTASLYRHVYVFGLPKRQLLQETGRRQLRDMFCEKRLTVDEIADSLGHRKIAIARALEFHDLLRERQDTEHSEEAQMNSLASADDFLSVQRVLGRELKKQRQQRRWTRNDLLERLDSDASGQMIATYELGTRKISVTRLFELCLAMDESPSEIVARVQRQVLGDSPRRIHLNLRKVVENERQELEPLRRWAATLLNQDKPVTTYALDKPALNWLADVCSMSVLDLETTLKTMATRYVL